MINVASIWAIALAEMRTARRLARTWVFIILACLAAAGQFINLTMTHTVSSGISASAGLLGPRFLMAAASAALLLIFQIGIIFLAFDVRARDMRDRIAGVLDSRPFTNLELLIGRLTGVTLLLAIPSFLMVVFITLGSYLLVFFNAPFGDVIEPYSVLSFLTLDLVPNLAFWGTLTIFFAVLIRLRFIVVVLMLGLVISFFSLTAQLPMYLLEPISTITSSVIYPSDLAPEFANGLVLWQRLALILIIGGLLTLSALMYPRPDGQSKLVVFGSGAACLAIGLGIFTVLVQNSLDSRADFERLALLHSGNSNAPRADIIHLGGEITIDPGDELELKYEITFLAPEDAHRELLFAFNPGLQITEATLDGEAAVYQFEDGLIRLQFVKTDTNNPRLLTISANGYPDTSFGYLDGKMHVYSENAIQGQALGLLGFENAVFHNSYVGLTPGIKWYPTAGAAFGEDDYENIPRDQFTVDLEVTVPKDWTVAGPGSRETLATGEETKFRFAPQATVPEVALFGSRFVRRSLNIAGVEFELLFSPKHTRNLELFADVIPTLEREIGMMFTKAEELGLAYPYEMFSLVEVPSIMRTYGGGWRMDSIHALPGILMIRESGFPTARFENRLETTEEMEADENYMAELQFGLLDSYFQNDVSGGNPFITASRNFLNYQIYPTGKGADALAYVTNALVGRVLHGRTGFFSIYFAGDQSGMQMTVGNAMAYGFSDRVRQFANNLRDMVVNRPSVWEGVISTALADVNLHADPQKALNVITLKGEAVADSLKDSLSAEDIGRLLSTLRSRHAGGSYTYDDFRAAAGELQIDFESIIGDWLNERDLPGFQLYQAEVVRLADDSLGVPEYQTTFYLTNEEPAPGVVSISFEERRRGDAPEGANWIPPIHVPAMSYSQVALHSEYAIESIRVRPYLSLNRETIEIDVEEPESWDPQPLEKLPLFASVDWRPPEHDYIVIDDLDEGFFVTGGEDRKSPIPGFALWMMRTFMGDAVLNPELDQGLPAFGVGGLMITGEAGWYRDSRTEAFGTYRHTTATAFWGGGDAQANFRTHLSSNGRWQLEYHFPVENQRRWRGRENRTQGATIGFQLNFGGMKPEGNYDITVKDGEREIPVEFDASIASYGWNRLGEFLLEQREVDVSISNVSGSIVFADAVRWTPIERTN